MANNRMWLVKKSEPDKRILLAKYYPSTGWYMFHDQEKLDDWFDQCLNQERTCFGSTDLQLVFEIEDDSRPPKTH